MIRVLFSVLAVVVAVLAIVLEQPVLYAAAAVLLLIVLILMVKVLRQRHREALTPYMSASSPSDELKSLGIMEIRPKERSQPQHSEANGAATPAAGREPTVATHPASSSPGPVRPPKVYEASATARPVARVRPEKEAVPQQEDVGAAAEAAPGADGESLGEQVLVPYLQALRAAVGAQTVCLLKQEDIAPEYHVMALVGQGQAAVEAGSFIAPVPLLTASMTQHPVTVRHVGEGGISADSLGYSTLAASARQVALAPVPRPLDPVTYFLLADAAEDDLLSQARSRTLLAQFARLLGSLLETIDIAEKQRTARPRRDIIADEMEQARARNQLLALALIYLNRAEALADEGEAAVATAERLLEERLQQVARHGRIVRFGELTYGIFYEGDILEIEAWGARVQQALTEEAGPLEGGVSVGIALLQDRHQDPDDFRYDATEALREAFESGTCTILE